MNLTFMFGYASVVPSLTTSVFILPRLISYSFVSPSPTGSEHNNVNWIMQLVPIGVIGV
ncbi:hypothetical protein [Bacillus thuringiensis]